MDIRITVALKHDKEGADFCDEKGAPLTLTCSVSGVSPADEYKDPSNRTQIYLPFIWAACKYYGIRDIVRLKVKTEMFGSVIDNETKRVDPVRQKELMIETCHNCGHYDEVDECREERCVWTPRRGFIDTTDDESRCSECGWLVSSSESNCPNCLARF